MKSLLVLIITVLALDFIGLTYLFNDVWNNQILLIQSKKLKVNPYGAIFSYIFLIMGLIIFVKPLVKNNRDCVKYGALYGLVVYGVFDMTNLAILEDYKVSTALIDISWGMFVSTIALYLSTVYSL